MNYERVEADYFDALSTYDADPYMEIELWPPSNFVGHLRLIIKGAEGTPYAGGVFEFEIKMFNDYPFSPPGVFCHTPIWHPNIALNRVPPSEKGWRDNVCFDMIDPRRVGHVDPQTQSAGWTPTKDLVLLLESLKLMIHCFPPFFNPEDPLNEEAAQEFKTNVEAFNMHAKEMTDKYAKKG